MSNETASWKPSGLAPVQPPKQPEDVSHVLIEVNVLVKPNATSDLNRLLAVLNKIKQRYGLKNAQTRFDAGSIIVSWKEILVVNEDGGCKEDAEGQNEQEAEEDEVDADGWTELTDSMLYLIEDGHLRLGHKKDGKINPSLRIPMEQLKELYDRLPDEADSSDVRRVATELNLNITSFETYIMRVLSRRAEFGGELIKEGRTLKLIKDSQYLREENRRRFEQEKQVIGTPWGAEA